MMAISRLRRRARFVALAALLLATGAVWLLRGPIFSRNFAAVEPGMFYRSAQPREELDSWIHAHGIRSIVNLRGGSMRDEFFRHEVQTAKDANVALFQVPMSAVKRPRRADLLTLIEIFESSDPPFLIHCKQGADRTGLATAVYRMWQLGEPPEVAESTFAMKHAHFPFFGTQRLHEPLNEYRDWLRSNRLSHTQKRFRDWVCRVYKDKPPMRALATKADAPNNRR